MTVPALLYVVYRGRQEDRFDRDHYVRLHLPLVRASFDRFGLLELCAFFPADPAIGTVAVCECRFRDDAAVAAAFASEAAAAVMADVERFTDLVPERWRGMPFVAGEFS